MPQLPPGPLEVSGLGFFPPESFAPLAPRRVYRCHWCHGWAHKPQETSQRATAEKGDTSVDIIHILG